MKKILNGSLLDRYIREDLTQQMVKEGFEAALVKEGFEEAMGQGFQRSHLITLFLFQWVEFQTRELILGEIMVQTKSAAKLGSSSHVF
jgi:hypothetical protein